MHKLLNIFKTFIKIIVAIVVILALMIFIGFAMSEDRIEMQNNQVCHTTKSTFSLDINKQCFEIGKEITK